MDSNYEAPTIVELGTVAELTLNLRFGNHLDSGFTGAQDGPGILSGPRPGR